jgi:dihydroorotase
MSGVLLEMRAPDDLHVHLRQGEPMRAYARDARDSGVARLLAMPNTQPPVVDAASMRYYAAGIAEAAPGLAVVPCFMLTQATTPETVDACADSGAKACKYYPAGATTNSEQGVRDIVALYPAIAALEARSVVLSIHGELPQGPALGREEAFLPVLKRLVSDFPRLRIVLEHVSSAAAVEALSAMPDRVGAGLTAHHLMFTIDDMIASGLDPHLYCKPPLKTERDRDALRVALLSGDPRYFYGSDSAPHPLARKESGSAPSGIYSMPCALSLVASFMAERGRLDLLEPFTAERGAAFYALAPNESRVELREEEWTVPVLVGEARPLLAGKRLGLRIARIG